MWITFLTRNLRGNSPTLVCTKAPTISLFSDNAIAEELTDPELAYLRHFALKIEAHMTDDTFAKLPFAFPEANIATFKITKARAEFLSAFKPVAYDCCIASCCCYVGPHANLQACPYCKEPRFNARGHPRKRFTYVPIIPRLKAFYESQKSAQSMQYRGKFQRDSAGTIKDIFDSKNYIRLCQTFVTIDGRACSHKFFADLRDIALGLSTDGFCPFRKRKKTCWPILVYNYNLPPEIRFWIRHILCVGVVPGPNKPKDFDSFLWPAVEELLQLAMGVKAYDITRGELFALRAFLIVVFGDIPAVSMVMRIKGHNGLLPCRMCKIRALRIPDSRAPTHYVPHNRAQHPSVKADAYAIKVYDTASLPLRTHAEFTQQAREVQMAPNEAQSQQLAKEFGIKGISVLSYLSSLFFPLSFPYDFMHLIFENVIKNLILLWTGQFKNLDEGNGEYELMPKVWEAVGAATAACGSSIPSAFGARPPNVSDDKMASTADTWSFWMLYLGPVLLSKRFRRRLYFDHFIRLVKLIHICLQFEISQNDIVFLRTGFQQWVEDYEKYVQSLEVSCSRAIDSQREFRLYYQYKPERLSACPITIHALLHIADGIEDAGPVWTSWAFPTERFCGQLLPAIRSRRHPFSNIDNYIVASAQLSQIKIRFGLEEELALKPKQTDLIRGSVSHPSCMSFEVKSNVTCYY